ncbi:MAG: sugar isomerase, partial [Bacillota bacterium]
RKRLQDAQTQMNAIDAEQCLQDAFFTDVRPLLAEWRQKHHLDPDPIAAYRASGYQERIAKERKEARTAKGMHPGS